MSSANQAQGCLTVVGGCYFERQHFPAASNIYGSGLRAAAAISKRKAKIALHTYVGKSELPELESTAGIFGIELHASTCDMTHGFEYLHSLASPWVYPIDAPASKPLEVSAERILCFGMMEGNAIIQGQRVVYDPQSPTEPRHFASTGSKAEKLAIVCNKREAHLLTDCDDLAEAGQRLQAEPGVCAVVIKLGAVGALVFVDGEMTPIPAYRGRSTSLIGSGDVFSAIFAYHWLVLEESAPLAALSASQSTAFYCATQVLPVPSPLPTSFEIREVSAARKRPLVYLAGPFFNPQELWMIVETRQNLSKQGMDVFSPFHDVGLGPPNFVATRDIEALRTCDFVFALLDGNDPGTLFEIGYARAINKPVIAFAASEEKVHLTMLLGTGCQVFHNYVEAIYAAAWLE